MLKSILSACLVAAFRFVNLFVAWHRLPRYVGALNLIAFRVTLRKKNLHDTRTAIPRCPFHGQGTSPNPDTLATPACDPRLLAARSSEGLYNDLSDPVMGAAHVRFGRNVPLDRAVPQPENAGLLEPSPRLISQRLLARPLVDGVSTFVPATSINLLAAAWIQFMTHDWFHHGAQCPADPFKVPLDTQRKDGWHGNDQFMEIRRTPIDPTCPAHDSQADRDDHGKFPPAFLNDGSHWWDGSQIYGNDEASARALRCDDYEQAHVDGKPVVKDGRPVYRDARGELRLTPAGELPLNLDEIEQSGLVDNWWVGLSLLHTLFAQEHNAVAAKLRVEFPTWDGDRIFNTARLVVVALMAKIHTVEWTPAILNHPTIEVALNANWWGLLTEKVTKNFGRLSAAEEISGIPGSKTDHHGSPYCLTEEFVSVYRLHPLLPEQITLYRASDGSEVRTIKMPDLLDENAHKALDIRPDGPAGGRLTFDDVCYSFGIANPGAVTLHNYPNFLRNLTRKDEANPGQVRYLDMAAVDVLRDRERGVPRYNDFRELIHRGRVHDFDQITSNKTWAKELEDVYGNVDRVDLMVGMFAEDPPKGFGFSDTAFRVFILMASRRIESDRFLSVDYNENVYTKVGLDWVSNNSMRSIILRHLPRVAPLLRESTNAFKPWPTVQQATGRPRPEEVAQ